MYKRSKDLQPTLRDLLTPLNHLFHISDMHTHYLPYVINEIAEIKVSYHPFYNIPERVTINSSYDALEIFRNYRDHSTINYCETCYVIFTNNSKEVIGIYNFSKGTDTKTTFSCKQIIAIALKVNATGLLIAHNHTGVSIEPSLNDRMTTIELEKGLKYFDLVLLDHLIVNPDKQLYSFKQSGDL